MTLDEFTTKWNNKPVDFDGIYPNQCMDLMHQYIYEVLGFTDKSYLAAPAAKDVYLRFPNISGSQQFTQIGNTPDGIPHKGDLVFWGDQVGQYGHVSIFIEGDINQFKSFDANWPVNSLCHFQNHNYNGVLGWFRPKSIPVDIPIASNQTFNDQTKIPAALLNWSEDLEIQQIRGLLGDLKRYRMQSPITLASFSVSDLFGELRRRILG